MKKYQQLISSCNKEPFQSECKPVSKIEGYNVRVKENKALLEQNMLKNYLCSVTFVHKLASNDASAEVTKHLVDEKVSESLKAAASIY